MSDDAEQIIKEEGNVEAFELRELTDNTQCEHCHRYATAGHIYSICGHLLKYENPSPEVQSREGYDLLTTPAVVVKEGPGRG